MPARLDPVSRSSQIRLFLSSHPVSEWAVRRFGGRSLFLRNVSVMLVGAVIGQATSLLLSPVLTRLFTPTEFGVLSVYTSALGILVVMGSMRYEMATPLVESDTDAANMVALCGCVLLGTTTLLAIVSFAAPERWLDAISLSSLSQYRALVPIGFFGLGGYFVMLAYATRAGAFGQIARTRISQGVLGPLAQVGLGLAGAGAAGLALGYVVGQSSGTITLLRRLGLTRRAVLREISLARMISLARRYSRFPLIASWAALIDAAGTNQVLYILITAQYSARIAGFVFLAERIVARPLLMLGTSVLQVFIGEAGKTARSDPARLRKRFFQVASRQFMIGLVWVVLANIAAATLFGRVFGAEWADAALYLRAISLAYLAQSVVQPVFHTLQILERQTLAASWQIGRFILVSASFSACVYAGTDAWVAILCYAVAQAAACVALFGLMVIAIEDIQP